MINICSATRKTVHPERSVGFALPTVIIASIIMLAVLLVSVASTTAIRVSFLSQYYDQIAKNAGDAGVAYAKACLAANPGAPQWTNEKPLKPNTDCSGDQLAGFLCPFGSTDARCWFTIDSVNHNASTFTVGLSTLVGGLASKVNSVGSMKLFNSSNGGVWRQYNHNSNYSLPASQTAQGSNGCPDNINFIAVPGSDTYGTANFCVMKYEAKDAGSNVPVSQASGTPWVSISQQTAMNNSPNVSGCTGCHLITEAEWLTIAQNVLGVASNWSTGIVGSGTVYRGHSDNQPTGSLEASTNDADGYYGETNTGGNQRRTLTLSNGEVIWDLAGNVYDWTSGTVTTGQPGITGESAYAWKEWTAPGFNNGTLSPDPSPTATGISDASGWNSGNAIGKLWSNSGDTTLRGFIRGGHWSAGANAGVLALYLNFTPDSTGGNVGFRVTSPPI